MPDAGFGHLAIPVASEVDARATARALMRHAPGTPRVTPVHVVGKAGGAPDKAGVQQREEVAYAAFAALRKADDRKREVGTEITHDTVVANDTLWTAMEADVDAVAFTPRGGGCLDRLFTGNVGREQLDGSDIPVLILPEVSP